MQRASVPKLASQRLHEQQSQLLAGTLAAAAQQAALVDDTRTSTQAIVLGEEAERCSRAAGTVNTSCSEVRCALDASNGIVKQILELASSTASSNIEPALLGLQVCSTSWLVPPHRRLRRHPKCMLHHLPNPPVAGGERERLPQAFAPQSGGEARSWWEAPFWRVARMRTACGCGQ